MKTHLLPVFILMVLLGGCKHPSGTYTNDNPDNILSKSGGELVLKFGEKRVVGDGDFTVEFVDVVGDSRCPQNIMCVWAGNGEIQILFNREEARLNTYLEPQEVTVSGITIKLVELFPYPVHERPIEEDDYKIRLLIKKE